MTIAPKKWAADLAATTLTNVTGTAVGAGEVGTYLINFVNRGSVAATVRLAIVGSANVPAVADYIEYDAPLPAAGAPSGGVLSRWPIPLGENWRVYAYSSTANVSVNVIGIPGS